MQAKPTDNPQCPLQYIVGLGGGSVRAVAGWRCPAPLDLPRVRSCSAGAHRLRACGEPGAGQRSNPEEMALRAALGLIGQLRLVLLSSSEAWRVLRWPTYCFMPQPHWWPPRHSCAVADVYTEASPFDRMYLPPSATFD